MTSDITRTTEELSPRDNDIKRLVNRTGMLLLLTESHNTAGTWAVDSEGQPVSWSSHVASCYCLHGALRRTALELQLGNDILIESASGQRDGAAYEVVGPWKWDKMLPKQRQRYADAMARWDGRSLSLVGAYWRDSLDD